MERTLKERFDAIRTDLLSVWEQELGETAKGREDVEAAKALSAVWEDVAQRVFGAIDSDFEILCGRGRPDSANDPLSGQVDLLGPVGLERRETIHTQAIRYLLDPRADHGLGPAPLRAMLGMLKRSGTGGSEVLDEAMVQAGGAHVYAEVAEYVQAGGETERPRTDLWIEVPLGLGVLLVVIENKVDDELGEGQLEAYEEMIKKRTSASPVPLVCRVLLTIEGDAAQSDDHEWTGISHLRLAGALSGAAVSAEMGANWLRLYVATVLRHLYRLRWSDVPSRRDKARLIVYLSEQFAEAS